MTLKRSPCQDVDEFVWWGVTRELDWAVNNRLYITWPGAFVVEVVVRELTSRNPVPRHPRLRKFLGRWKVRTMMARHLGELTLARELRPSRTCPYG